MMDVLEALKQTTERVDELYIQFGIIMGIELRSDGVVIHAKWRNPDSKQGSMDKTIAWVSLEKSVCPGDVINDCVDEICRSVETEKEVFDRQAFREKMHPLCHPAPDYSLSVRRGAYVS